MGFRGGRARLLYVLGGMCGCLTQNPAYDEPSGPLSESGGPVATAEPATTSTTSTTTTTTSATTSTSTTLELSSGSGGLGETTTGTTLALTTGDADTTTGGPTVAELKHYDPAACVEPLWCYGAGDIWNGLDGEVRGAECFDSPVAPPYRVRRIDYVLVAVRDQARVRFQVRSGDLQQLLYTSESLGLPATAGSLQIPEPLQPVLEDTRFCVGFIGGDPTSTIGFGADASMLPPDQQSFFGSNGPCDEPGLRDVNTFTPEIDPHGPWCLGAEVARDE